MFGICQSAENNVIMMAIVIIIIKHLCLIRRHFLKTKISQVKKLVFNYFSIIKIINYTVFIHFNKTCTFFKKT